MLRISWTKKLSNEKVLEVVNKERSLLVTIRKRQLNFMGHIMRKNVLEKLIEGKIEGNHKEAWHWLLGAKFWTCCDVLVDFGHAR